MQEIRLPAVMLVCALATATATAAIKPCTSVPLRAETADTPMAGPSPAGQSAPDSKSADTIAAQETQPTAGSAKCKEAEVNPVTGHAECIRPRGAAVDPPPQSAVPCSTQHEAGAKRGCPQSPTEGDSSRP